LLFTIITTAIDTYWQHTLANERFSDDVSGRADKLCSMKEEEEETPAVHSFRACALLYKSPDKL
jgi:hypothetical protein